MAKVSKRTWKNSEGEDRQAWRVDFTDRGGKRQRKQFSTKREADDFRVEIENQLRSGTFRRGADKTTVKDICISFLEYAERRCERGERFVRSHLEAVAGHVWNYICPDQTRREANGKSAARPFTEGIENIKLSQLSPKGVAAFRDRLRDAGVSVPMTRKIITTLHAILEYAKEQDAVATNAAQGIKVIGRRDEGSKKVTPPSTELVKLLLSLADLDFRVRIMIAAATGIRVSEQNALRWHHFDLEAGLLKIRVRVDRHNTEDAPKSHAAMRDIPLARPVIDELKMLMKRSAFHESDDLVFPNEVGSYTSHSNMLKRKFSPLIKRLKELHEKDPEKYPKVEHITWHGLRHYGISAWIHQRLSPKAIQTFAGHTNLAFTMDRYGHLFPSEDHNRAFESIASDLIRW
jgi:integrase